MAAHADGGRGGLHKGQLVAFDENNHIIFHLCPVIWGQTNLSHTNGQMLASIAFNTGSYILVSGTDVI